MNQELFSRAETHLFAFGSPFHPEVIVKTEDLYLYTADGRKIMDWTSGQMSCLLGHGHTEIVETLHRHAASLDHLYSGMLSPPVIQLAERLTGALPAGLDKCMFLSTGGESNECAIRLAKVVTGKFEIVGLGASWHGVTAGANGAQYHAGRKGCGPLVPGMHMLPTPDSYRSIFRHKDGTYDWQTELDYGWSLIDKASCDSLAAVIMEPILSSGGMITIPSGYMKAMKEHCERRGMLLIVDEAQTGLGRCGNMFAIQHEGVTPDILTLSKTLGNGLPLSAVITSDSIATVATERNFLFYTTHANDPLPAAVGLQVLSIVQRDGLAERARIAGEKLHSGLRALQDRYTCIGEVRGRGLLAGLEIVGDCKTKKADVQLGKQLSEKMLELGLSAMISARNAFSGCIRIAPPITITDEQLDLGLAIMEQAFEAICGKLTAGEYRRQP